MACPYCEFSLVANDPEIHQKMGQHLAEKHSNQVLSGDAYEKSQLNLTALHFAEQLLDPGEEEVE